MPPLPFIYLRCLKEHLSLKCSHIFLHTFSHYSMRSSDFENFPNLDVSITTHARFSLELISDTENLKHLVCLQKRSLLWYFLQKIWYERVPVNSMQTQPLWYTWGIKMLLHLRGLCEALVGETIFGKHPKIKQSIVDTHLKTSLYPYSYLTCTWQEVSRCIHQRNVGFELFSDRELSYET